MRFALYEGPGARLGTNLRPACNRLEPRQTKTNQHSSMSTAKLKPLNEQVIVLTGASTGIGLATARLAVKRGAKVVMAARSEARTRVPSTAETKD